MIQRQLDLLGALLAPKVYMHPLDWTSLADVKLWMENNYFYGPAFEGPFTLEQYWERFDPNPSDDFQFQSVSGPRSMVTAIWDSANWNDTFTTAQIKEMSKGDPVVNGVSTAKVYFTTLYPNKITGNAASERGNMTAFVYNLWYPFNGCSNQLLSLDIDGKYEGAEYFMCTPGVHEGDLEHVSTLTCTQDLIDLIDANDTVANANASSLIRRQLFSQHGWKEEFNCEKQECPMDVYADGTTRATVYSGLFSHANYPTASPLQVYVKVNTTLVSNLDGLFLGDRTSDQGPVWIPTTANTVRMPHVQEMTEEQKKGEWRWALFPGSAGADDRITTVQTSVTCLSDNITVEGPCNTSNPAVFFLTKALDLVGELTSFDDLTWTSTPVDKTALPRVAGLTLPLFRDYTYKYTIGGIAAPVATDSPPAVCPFTGDPSDTAPGSDAYEIVYFNGLGWFLGTVVGIMLGCGVLYTLLLCFPGVNDRDLRVPLLSKRARRGERERVKRESMTGVGHTSSVSAATAAPGSAADSSIANPALNQVSPNASWGEFNNAFIVVCAIFAFLQLVTFCMVMFLRSHSMLWFGCGLVKNPCAKWRKVDNCAFITQACVNGFIVIQINVAVVIFAAGFSLWCVRGRLYSPSDAFDCVYTCVCVRVCAFAHACARFLFQQGCNATFTKIFGVASVLGDLCLNFDLIGLGSFCGSDLAALCSFWNGLRVQFLCWGSYLFLLSFLMFLGALVHNMYDLPGKVEEETRDNCNADAGDHSDCDDGELEAGRSDPRVSAPPVAVVVSMSDAKHGAASVANPAV
ncbi:hypothetical protein FOA52_002052 [Chlamydomonas sp. UWO 241]|nr:hypothetical protein FOA52_002052 [Chlamydomonas sp. UWO 241]